MKNNFPKPVRIVMFVAAVIWIVHMWVKKDIAATLAVVPAEAAVPMIVTSLAVTLIKAALLTAVILGLKLLVTKIGGGRN